VTSQVEPIKPTDARMRLLDAAVDVILAQGYSAATLVYRCAGLTKGGFYEMKKLGIAELRQAYGPNQEEKS